MSNLSTAYVHTLESVFEGIGLGIVATDKRGAVLFSNPAAATVLGIEEKLVPLESWASHYGIYLSDGITLCPITESPLVRAVAGEEASNLEVFIQNKLGSGRSCWCTIDLRPLRSDDGEVTGALLLIQENSKQKSLSEELARSNRALKQFATVAAHDLQEPLRSISGFADMLAQYQVERLDERSERCMNKIKEGVIRMQTLINDLLAYSLIQTNPQVLKPTNCNKILANCIKNLDASISASGAMINFTSLPVVMADAGQIAQLLQNLIGNAVKFSAAGRAPVVRITAERKTNSWLFSVQDNGIGIAPEFNERVFRIFQRLHTSTTYSGTGIGLAICQTIVARHGGRIWVESEPGIGSTFYFTIPDSEMITRE